MDLQEIPTMNNRVFGSGFPSCLTLLKTEQRIEATGANQSTHCYFF
jgi:hypothetical protein